MQNTEKPLVFFSYAREDERIAHLLTQVMRAGGASVFMDVRDLELGELWEQRITSEILKCDRVVVFWSKNALTSTWVNREVSLGIELEKSIVPIVVAGVAIPPALSAYHGIHNIDVLFSEVIPLITANAGLHIAGANLVRAILGGSAYKSVRT